MSIPEYRKPGFFHEKAGFSVMFKGELLPYRVMGIYVLPGEEVVIDVIGHLREGGFVINLDGVPIPYKEGKVEFGAPSKPGVYELKIARSGRPADSVTLNVFVMVPYREASTGSLNGYRISRYPSTALRGAQIYEPPKGFIKVTKENEDVLVSPHFRLGQFVCKQEGGYPKYVALQEKLLLKLEMILARLNERGYSLDTLHIMSGYRTPAYNKAIGNGRYSRHQWGDAADIFVDEAGDGMMDDLNGDGRVDRKDASIIYEIVEELDTHPATSHLKGGLAIYGSNGSHGPFVHVDARGFKARW
ncbi:MAG: D-Ala-D-Ala carboxypeptidase family metallohydrolase [Candidatus Methanosuratincola sp.]